MAAGGNVAKMRRSMAWRNIMAWHGISENIKNGESEKRKRKRQWRLSGISGMKAASWHQRRVKKMAKIMAAAAKMTKWRIGGQ